jgi:hypothetical protein
VKHVVYTAEEEFSKREAVTTGQMRCHHDVVQGGLIGFPTENKSAQPHIQKGSVFNFTQGIVLHVFHNVLLVSVPWLHPCLPGGVFEIPRLNRSYNVKAGDHIYVGQGGRHRTVAKKESVDVV